jgi:tyrosinase
VHINQTLSIHGTGNFLSWHRYYTWAFEKALRDECDYKGYQPYWNWGKSAKDPANSPYFDGSPWSMSGNGDFQAHNDTPALPTNINNVPAGQGGGCVKNGPFKKFVLPHFLFLIIQQLDIAHGTNNHPACPLTSVPSPPRCKNQIK